LPYILLSIFQGSGDDMPPYFVFLTLMSFYIFLQEKVIFMLYVKHINCKQWRKLGGARGGRSPPQNFTKIIF
jgi:hypothetical protein